MFSFDSDDHTWGMHGDELFDGNSNKETLNPLPCRFPAVKLSVTFSIHIREDPPRE